ncbi:MAG: thiol peroxidase [Flavobacteriales bacterium]
MSNTKLGGTPITTKGDFPKVGDQLPNVRLIKSDLSELTNADLKGKKVVFNVFPSVDTDVCAMQLGQFSNKLKDREDIMLVFASMDLPFALKRFCGDKGIENAVTTSDFRHKSIANNGMEMEDGALAGLYARGVMVTDETGKITYSELCNDIVDEPNYEEALKGL